MDLARRVTTAQKSPCLTITSGVVPLTCTARVARLSRRLCHLDTTRLEVTPRLKIVTTESLMVIIITETTMSTQEHLNDCVSQAITVVLPVVFPMLCQEEFAGLVHQVRMGVSTVWRMFSALVPVLVVTIVRSVLLNPLIVQLEGTGVLLTRPDQGTSHGQETPCLSLQILEIFVLYSMGTILPVAQILALSVTTVLHRPLFQHKFHVLLEGTEM